MSEGGEYHASWHHCPMCGTKWDKMRTTDCEWFKDQQIGPRRMKIEKATYEYYRAPNRSRYNESDPPFWYVLEEKMHWHCRTPDDAEWTPKYRMAGLQVSAIEALEFKRHYMERNREQTEERYDWDHQEGEPLKVEYTLVYHFRLVVVKSSEAERQYPHVWRHLNTHRIYRKAA